MFIGETVLTKIHGVVTEAIVIAMYDEDVKVRYEDNKECYKKYWEVQRFTQFDLP